MADPQQFLNEKPWLKSHYSHITIFIESGGKTEKIQKYAAEAFKQYNKIFNPSDEKLPTISVIATKGAFSQIDYEFDENGKLIVKSVLPSEMNSTTTQPSVFDMSAKKPTQDNKNKNRYDWVPAAKASIRNSDLVLLATDPDNEGEGIASDIVDLIDPKKIYGEKIMRTTFNEITQKAVSSSIIKTLKTNRQINPNIVAARNARQLLDLMVGELSREAKHDFAKKFTKNHKVDSNTLKQILNQISIGRVVSPVYTLLNQIIDSYNPLAPDKNVVGNPLVPSEFPVYARLQSTDASQTETNKFHNMKLTSSTNVSRDKSKIYEALAKNDIPVKYEYVGKPTNNIKTVKPLTLYDLSALILKKYPSIHPEEISKITQLVYDSGLMSYPRTDATRLPEDFAKSIYSKFDILDREKLNQDYETKIKPSWKHQDATNVQDAHTSLYPIHCDVQTDFTINDKPASKDSIERARNNLLWMLQQAGEVPPNAKLESPEVLKKFFIKDYSKKQKSNQPQPQVSTVKSINGSPLTIKRAGAETAQPISHFDLAAEVLDIVSQYAYYAVMPIRDFEYRHHFAIAPLNKQPKELLDFCKTNHIDPNELIAKLPSFHHDSASPSLSQKVIDDGYVLKFKAPHIDYMPKPTTANLVELLERTNIGRPSTIISTIQNGFDRGWLKVNSDGLIENTNSEPSKYVAEKVKDINWLTPELTAQMNEWLEEIIAGKKTIEQIVMPIKEKVDAYNASQICSSITPDPSHPEIM